VREVKAKAIEQLKIEHPDDAFDGDSLDFLRCVYRNPDFDISVRLDAAKAATKYERPSLQAVITKDVSSLPTTSAAIEDAIASLLGKGTASVVLDARPATDSAGESESVGQAGAAEVTPSA
jgi:hypothetical protein